MEMDHLMDRLGTEPNLSIKLSVSIVTMLNFDGDGDGHGNGDGTCKTGHKASFTSTVQRHRFSFRLKLGSVQSCGAVYT